MTHADSDERRTLHDLMAMVGYLLLRWSEVERHFGRKLPPSLDHVRLMRNRLCHGLQSARALPGEMPQLTCYDDCKKFTYTWADLDGAIRDLEMSRGDRTSSSD